MKKEEIAHQKCSEIENDTCLEIGYDNILAKGFGALSKIVMLDHNLSIEAKSLYAFICSFCGNGKIAFPSREYILGFLNIGKRAYYNAFNELKKNKLINIEIRKNKGMFANNAYSLNTEPVEYLKKIVPCINETDTLCLDNIFDQGYGSIPKLVMINKDLSPKAKALYAYLITYTGAGQTAFPKKQFILYHLNICDATYQKCMKELINANYINVSRKRLNGKIAGNEYKIVNKPWLQENDNHLPHTKNEDTVNEDMVMVV